MPRPRLAMRKVREVLRLAHSQGLSTRQIGASLGIPSSTVGDHLKRAALAGLSWPLPEDLDDSALEQLLFPSPPPRSIERPVPDWSQVHKELRRKGVTLLLLWIEYRERHPEGFGYSWFCQSYREFAGRVDLVMRQEHRAGEKCFVDFPGQRLPIYDRRSGAVAFEAELFVGVLGASNYLYAEAVSSQKLPAWITAHVHMLEFFGAVPAILVSDGLRSAVRKAHRYEPEINATYQDFAAHYSMAVIPARPYKSRDKAKVEAGVLLAERWILAKLRNRRFYSLHEANAAIKELVEAINGRPFKKMEGSRRNLFLSIDRPAMAPLPALRYDVATWKLGLCVHIDYHIEADHHYYSVPHELVGRKVDVRLGQSTVEIFHCHKRVASWKRSWKKGGYSTDPAHMPESHRRHAQWSPGRIISWAKKTGPATGELAEAILESRPHPEQGYRSCLGIIRLSDRYGPERLEAACRRALQVRAYSYRSVESILSHGLDRQPLPERRPQPVHPYHDNLRGPSYYR